MENRKRQQAQRLYLTLAGLFIAALVSCNLIFQKFFSWSPFTWLNFGAAQGGLWHSFTRYTFQISVGTIPYPLTFLITDMISEIFGRKKADQVVIVGLLASLFVMILVIIANNAEATSWSPVSGETFSKVFGLTTEAVAASMLAYLTAQFVDIRLFHFWKNVTKGKMLWVRNNFSTMTSQIIDTSLVLLVLCATGAIQWQLFGALFLNSLLFKVMFAALDTPIIYLVIAIARKHFGLEMGEEIQLV